MFDGIIPERAMRASRSFRTAEFLSNADPKAASRDQGRCVSLLEWFLIGFTSFFVVFDDLRPTQYAPYSDSARRRVGLRAGAIGPSNVLSIHKLISFRVI